MEEPILEITNLTTSFYRKKELLPAVDNVSFSISKGQTVCVVGESGSGKSVTALSIMRLIPEHAGKITGGEIVFKGKDLLKLSDKDMRAVRGNRVSMVFQEPMTTLNPVFTIGNQLMETIMMHQNVTKKEAMEKALEMLKKVNIPSPAQRLQQYPHQLSGGMRQRVVIAMALVCKPELLVADEPTTALDVTTQAQILKLMNDLKSQTETAVLFITHNMGVVAATADKVIVMYCGRIVECSDAKTIFKDPKHPYTIGLLKSIPKIAEPQKKLFSIKGSVPAPGQIKKGCRFQSRCELVTEQCRLEEPPLIEKNGSLVRCWQI
ncbi:peptide/nickel transport system ATP-binding protein/oligopeptide transport system ATP-binding protein [Bacillus thermophilus]|uniref:Peptide/nickel transport system ATP-binding protein/oligopeptide transport system ATP-binding protein n=1 Tax=Siminovitchia thermophila TaxID=1245522 RepID=A0ABS2R805_9BACI|nr:ABC transporter ATP-binding protein [Siminovitchia thermophila]MBM7715773.1 peptide/nickel transport system ATP-binding protein/oligopeptide transport system ATP-binding protein [Siminovitchia thermophila]ONK23567.1 peptide ABC transporter ATP-binding protein [Bacillus sp. VT-16-64]